MNDQRLPVDPQTDALLLRKRSASVSAAGLADDAKTKLAFARHRLVKSKPHEIPTRVEDVEGALAAYEASVEATMRLLRDAIAHELALYRRHAPPPTPERPRRGTLDPGFYG